MSVVRKIKKHFPRTANLHFDSAGHMFSRGHNFRCQTRSCSTKNRIFGCYFSTFYNIFQLDRSLYNSPCFVFLDIWWEGPCNFVVQSYVILCNTAKNWQKSSSVKVCPGEKPKKSDLTHSTLSLTTLNVSIHFKISTACWCDVVAQLCKFLWLYIKYFKSYKGTFVKTSGFFRCVKIFTDLRWNC